MLFYSTIPNLNWAKPHSLKLANNGAILVNDYLQAISNLNIFVSGTIAQIPNIKASIVDERGNKQNKIIIKNIQNYINGKKLIRFKQNKRFRKFISTGNAYSVFQWNEIVLKGWLIWFFKKLLINKFMSTYKNIPTTDNEKRYYYKTFFKKQEKITYYPLNSIANAAKTSPDFLLDNLKNIEHFNKQKLFNLKEPITKIDKKGKKVLFQSVNFFRECISDLNIFGRLVANHCLNCFYAANATPLSALAIINLKESDNRIMDSNFRQMLYGATCFFREHKVKLLGGHTTKNYEYNTLGFSINGESTIKEESFASEEDLLILTKPIGTGVLLNASQQNKIKAAWYENLLKHFLLSNKKAAQIINNSNYSFCTSITGFGFLNSILPHLTQKLSLEINLSAIPLLEGFQQLDASPLLEENLQFFKNEDIDIKYQSSKELFDPQTCGGLLIAINPKKANELVEQLKEAGYIKTAIVGKIKSALEQREKIVIKN